MVTGPGLLIVDEPTRGLDYGAKSRIMALWRKWQQGGMSLLLVTHDVELAARVSERVLVLQDGQIVTEGPTREVMRESTVFSPQVARLFPESRWLTVDDVLSGTSPYQGE
jgi:energy-coupling factor transport system ATP-binding protein